MGVRNTIETYRSDEARYQSAVDEYEKQAAEYERIKTSDPTRAADIYKELQEKHQEIETQFNQLSQYRQTIADPVKGL